MQKITRISMTILSLCVSLFNSTPIDAKLILNRITNAAYGFSVTTPGSTWNLKTWRTDSEHGALFHFIHEQDATAQISSKAVHGGSVAEEYTSAITAFPPLTDVYHEEKQTPWGIIDCYYWNAIKDENLYNARLYAITYNGNTYSTICACLEEKLQEYENTFNAYVESIYLHPAQ